MSNTGVVIFDLNTYKPVHISSIATKDKDTHGKRLYNLATELLELKQKYNPSVIAIERGFSRFNTSTQVIYRVHGLVNYLFYDVTQVYYPPAKIKEIIIRGNASKKLVRQLIEAHYPDIEFNNEDESDAFAIGLTYLIKEKKMEWSKSVSQLMKEKRNGRN